MSSNGEKSSELNETKGNSLGPIEKKLWLKIYKVWFLWIFKILLKEYSYIELDVGTS